MKFNLSRELDDGQRVFISAYDSRIEAERQAQALRRFWPGVYVIRETPFPAQFSDAPPEGYSRGSRG